MNTASACGPELDHCTCRRRSPILRTAAQIAADHRAAVARARQSGFAREPLPGWLFQLLLPSSVNARQAVPARERAA